MNNAQTANIIRELCKQKNVSVSKFLAECGLRKSLIYDMEKRAATPSTEIMETIADYFNCSVDYILGRESKSEVFNTGSISYSAVGDHASNNIQCQSQAEAMDKEIFELIQSLPLREKTSLLSYAYELSDKIKTPVLSGTSVE